MNIRILESAKDDIKDGYWFYENREKGLGSYFKSVITTEIKSLRFYAGIHSKQFGYYRLLSRTFPYGVYYEINENTIVIYAVLDLRCNPKFIEYRLSKP